MATDPALLGWFGEATLHALHAWGGRVGAAIVMLAGYIIVSRNRKLQLDEILAGVGLLVWIVGDVINESLFGGADADVVKIWASRGVLLVVMLIGYAIARSQCAVSGSEEKA
jgi:hypothetical protein